jgi:hypothetical protein
MTPLELRVTTERRVLSVKWEDGDVSLIPASRLRARSRAAPHVRATVEGRGEPAGDVTLTGAETIGSYENKRNGQAFGFFSASRIYFPENRCALGDAYGRSVSIDKVRGLCDMAACRSEALFPRREDRLGLLATV